MALDFITLQVNSIADGSGAATDPATRSGEITAIALDYAATAAAGTDVVVSCANSPGPALAILTVTDNKTDGWYYPPRRRGQPGQRCDCQLRRAHALPWQPTRRSGAGGRRNRRRSQGNDLLRGRSLTHSFGGLSDE